MSAVAAKKPPVPSRDATASPTSRSTPRTVNPGSPASVPTVPRRGSVRGAAPVTARAAVQSRRESPLSNGVGGSGRNSPAPSTPNAAATEAEETARAEAVAAIDDLKERLTQAQNAGESQRRQAEVLQSRLDEAVAEQAKLEERVHEQEEFVETLRNEKREATRRIHELEGIYEAERGAMVREKEDFSNREEEMQAVIQRLKDSLANRTNGEDEARPSRQSTHSPVEGGFAPPASLQRSDSRNNSKLLLQKDKLIESLRLELAEAQIKLVESENQGGGRLQEVERLLIETRIANARLLEDNESYQMLLQERTLSGDFKGDFGHSSGNGGASSNQDALNALEGRAGDAPDATGTSLADELSEANDNEAVDYRKLELELRSAKDENKALTLYINKIIGRLLQRTDFEDILHESPDAPDTKPSNTNKELPPPPPPPGPSFLQRAKTIAMGRPASVASEPVRPRPRPMSFMPTSTNSAHANPETAPSIPIGLTRGTSVRRVGRPMSDQYTPGSVVHQMYRGDSAGGPLSPSSRTSQTFFSSAGSPGPRTPSGSHPQMSSSGNFPGMRSETSSTSGDSILGGTPGTAGTDVASIYTSSQSPPRASSEKATTFSGGGPRPLRLVQENPDIKSAETANKRASWIGWAFSKKDEPTTPAFTGEPLRE
ncbi:hypothetical protein RB594_008723 [Gaeumannomyces avenae]